LKILKEIIINEFLNPALEYNLNFQPGPLAGDPAKNDAFGPFHRFSLTLAAKLR
jgi:hypothetical protein